MGNTPGGMPGPGGQGQGSKDKKEDDKKKKHEALKTYITHIKYNIIYISTL